MKLFSSKGSRSAKQKTPSQTGSKRKKIILIVAIVLAVILGVVAVASSLVKPPQIGGSSNKVIYDRDGNVIEAENDGEIEIMGDRVADYFTFIVAVTDIDGTRTDNIIVGSFDTREDDTKINMMNVPRDTMSKNGRVGASRKINTAYGTSRHIEALKSELKNIVGFTADRYIVLNFEGIADIVDAIGGVEYDVPFRMKYDDPYQNLHIDLQPGVQTLNGQQAVEFLRWRKNSSGYRSFVPSEYDGSDQSRIQKQQEFLMTLVSEVLQIRNVLNIPSLSQAIFNSMETDFTASEVLWMGTKCLNMSADNINMLTLPGYGAYSYAGTNDWLSFYFPNERQTLAMVNEYLNPYDKQITSINVYSSPPEGTKRVEQSSSDGIDEEEDHEDTSEDEPHTENESDNSSNSGSTGNSSDTGNSNNTGNSNDTTDSGDTGNSDGQPNDPQPNVPDEQPETPEIPSDSGGDSTGGGTVGGQTLTPDQIPDWLRPSN